MTPEAGWYADPQGAGTRWWDGSAWTEWTDAAAPAAPATSAGPGAVAPWTGAPVVQAYGQPAASGVWPVAPVAPPVGVWRGPVDDRPWVQDLTAAVRVVLQKYAQFDGRAGRPEFWYWLLAVSLCYLGALLLAFIPLVGLIALVALLFGGLAIIVPNYAVLVRRLRDAGFHWAWIFLALAPLGGIALLVMAAQPSKFP